MDYFVADVVASTRYLSVCGDFGRWRRDVPPHVDGQFGSIGPEGAVIECKTVLTVWAVGCSRWFSSALSTTVEVFETNGGHGEDAGRVEFGSGALLSLESDGEVEIL